MTSRVCGHDPKRLYQFWYFISPETDEQGRWRLFLTPVPYSSATPVPSLPHPSHISTLYRGLCYLPMLLVHIAVQSEFSTAVLTFLRVMDLSDYLHGVFHFHMHFSS